MRIILAGTGSAVGKTTISTGIMKALSEKYNVQPFKVGPDYIDPSYHTLATGNVSRNLDSFFMSEGQVRDSFIKGMNGKDMGIIEMVKFEKEHLEMVVYTNPKVSDNYYIIVDYKTYKDTTKPYFVARNIKTGEEVHSRIKQGKIFKENPFGLYSVLKIEEFTPDFKKRFVNGVWTVTDEIEEVLTDYEVIK